MPTAIDTTRALITLAEAKEYGKVTSTGDDPIISAIINGVSETIQGYLKRNLVSTTYTEYYSGDSTRDLCLRNFPIVSLTSVNIDELRVWGSDTLVDLTNLIVKKSSGTKNISSFTLQ